MASEYFGVFPSVLFSCYDIVTPMHFILCLKNTSVVEKRRVENIMDHCGAEIIYDLRDATDNTIVIVDHDDVVPVSCPAFRLNYVLDCIGYGKVQNISASYYRQTSTRHLAKDAYLMDVVYFRKQSWSSLLTASEKIWIDENSIKDNIRGHASAPTNSITANRQIVIDIQSSSDSPQSSRIVENSIKDNARVHTSAPTNSITSNGQNIDIQSSSDSSQSSRSEQQTAEKLTKGKVNTDQQNKQTNAIEDTIEEANNENKKEIDSSCLKKTSSSSTLTYTKWVFPDSLEAEDSDSGSQPRHHPDKHSRLPYSREERIKIVKYIVDHNEYARVKGKDLWGIMEMRKVCPSRTWQSMKEHFMKKVIYDLSPFTFLTEEQKRKIKRACF